MKHGGVSVFGGVGERTREGNDLWLEFQESGVINVDDPSKSRAALVYGQMTEPPGARLRVGLSALDRRRVLPRRRRQGRAALHRQHLPLHAGRLRSVGAPRPHAVGGRLPADAADRDGRAAGTDHVDEERLDYLGAGDLRARRRLHRPGAGDDVRASRRDDEPVAADRGAGHLSGGRSAGVLVAHSRSAHHRRRALQRRARRSSRCCSATRTCRTSSRFSASTSCRKTTSSPCRARARSRSSCRSRSSSRSSSPASKASTCPIADTIRGFKEIVDGKHDADPGAGLLPRRLDRRSAREVQEAASGIGHGVTATPAPADRVRRSIARQRAGGRGRDPRRGRLFRRAPGHTPLLALLGAGELWYRQGSETHYLAIAVRLRRSAAGGA